MNAALNFDDIRLNCELCLYKCSLTHQLISHSLFFHCRNAYHITSYFMFYFNIFLGLISCLLRIIKSVIVGVIFLERVQRSLLPKSFEKMDPGEYSTVESQWNKMGTKPDNRSHIFQVFETGNVKHLLL